MWTDFALVRLFFRNAFIELDLELKKEHLRFTYNGSTCTASIITPTQIFIANLGDSRTILIRKPSGEDGDVPRKGRARRNSVKLGCDQHMGPSLFTLEKPIKLFLDPKPLESCFYTLNKFATNDHRPSEEHETERIKAAGCRVEIGRVAGDLAVSRALGDFQYKLFPNIGIDSKISGQLVL